MFFDSKKEVKLSNSSITALLIVQKTVSFLLAAEFNILYANINVGKNHIAVDTMILCNGKSLKTNFRFFLQKKNTVWELRDDNILYGYQEDGFNGISLNKNGKFYMATKFDQDGISHFREQFGI